MDRRKRYLSPKFADDIDVICKSAEIRRGLTDLKSLLQTTQPWLLLLIYSAITFTLIPFQVVNSHLVCDPTIRQPGFDLLGNSGLCWTVFARNKDTAVPAEGNGDLQTLICVLAARPRRCLTLSNPVPWQNWMVAYLGYTLRMKMLFHGWPIMVNDTHTRRSYNVRY